MKSYIDWKRTGILMQIIWAFIFVPSQSIWAWTEHPLVIHETLAALPEVRDAKLRGGWSR
jgi:hypothetical protein